MSGGRRRRSRHRRRVSGARRASSRSARPATDTGRVGRAGPAGEPGDPRGQARAALRGRAARDLAGQAVDVLGSAGRRRPDGPDRAPPDRAADHGEHLDLVAAADGRARHRRTRGAPGDLAVLAPVRRGAAPGPRRRRSPPTGRRGRRLGRRRGHELSRQPDPRPRPDHRTDRPAPLRRDERLPPHRRDHFTSHADPRRRAAHRRRGRRARCGGMVDRRRRADRAGIRSSTAPSSTPARSELVRAMATSGTRVQLALAPAGSGKTTAMRVLAGVWTEAGHDVSGSPPSAAAAAVLAEATGMPSETLAKLDHDLATAARLAARSLRSGRAPWSSSTRPAWPTPSPSTGSSASPPSAARAVRLIGDDQQLAAIGAGGVLRDIATTHGAVRLDEVVRFDDPVEAEASLGLRDGDRSRARVLPRPRPHPHRRQRDRPRRRSSTPGSANSAAGRECLMLAPTRDLVRELNERAHEPPTRGDAAADVQVQLRDGNQASVGDIVLTRRNDRRLGVSGTRLGQERRPLDRHRHPATAASPRATATPACTTVLPAEYVAAHVELGYATTVHAAQGITADVMHGILTGEETRQLLYTMLTRGRAENHLHVITDDLSDDARVHCPASTSNSPPSRSSTASSPATAPRSRRRRLGSRPRRQRRASKTQRRGTPMSVAVRHSAWSLGQTTTRLSNPARSRGSRAFRLRWPSIRDGVRICPRERDSSRTWPARSEAEQMRRCRPGSASTTTSSPRNSARISPCGGPRRASRPTNAPWPVRRRLTIDQRGINGASSASSTAGTTKPSTRGRNGSSRTSAGPMSTRSTSPGNLIGSSGAGSILNACWRGRLPARSRRNSRRRRCPTGFASW